VVLAQTGGTPLGGQPQGAAMTVVEPPCGHDFAPGTAAPVEIPGPIELIDDLVIAAMARALEHHLPIPAKTVCLQGGEDKVSRSRHLPRGVDVFDTHQPASLLRPGLQEAAKGGDQGSEVERTGR